jgi:hypothetical protein
MENICVYCGVKLPPFSKIQRNFCDYFCHQRRLDQMIREEMAKGSGVE